MKKIFAVIIALGFAGAMFAAPAQADDEVGTTAAKSFHVRDSSSSRGPVNIYSGSSCGSGDSIVILDPGEQAVSTGWDSLKVYGHGYDVNVYDGSNGAFITNQVYSSGHCKSLSKNHDYLVYVHSGS